MCNFKEGTMGIAEKLSSIEVLDPDGHPVKLGSLWEEKPVVLVFVRHFGRLFCREQVAQLRDAVKEIRALGSELVVVGNGRPEHADDFRKTENLAFPLLVDQDMVAYRAAGLRRGLTKAVSLRMMKHAMRARRKGFTQKKTQGDPWQLGGTFVITPEGKVLFSHVSQEAGDHPDPHDILAVLEKA